MERPHPAQAVMVALLAQPKDRSWAGYVANGHEGWTGCLRK